MAALVYIYMVCVCVCVLETQQPGFLLGHADNFCLSHTKIADYRSKESVQHRSFCLHKQFGHNKPLL